MRTEYVLAHAPFRMKELGVKNYTLAYRSLVIKAGETITLRAYGQYYFLVETEFLYLTVRLEYGGGAGSFVRVESDSGIWDWVDPTLNEQTYEHTGKIKVSNATASPVFLDFIVITPEVKSKKKKK
ncbi:MAG: hypothetical protein AB1458_12055 [Bacteroidota bacterium]